MDKKQLNKFKDFLSASGAQFLHETNPYEVLRFKANEQVGVIYKNSRDQITSFVGEAQKAWDAFISKKPYSANEVKKRVKKNIVLNTLLKRDGTNCFYCGKEMPEGTETIEHLFSVNQGGSNHIANLALAHARCNQQASSLSVVEKVKLREKNLSEEEL